MNTTTTTLPADKFNKDIVFVRPKNPPLRVPLDKLAVLPGFNTRVKDADYNERVSTIAASIVENGFFDDKPFAVTMLPDDDTVYIYDGEHRYDAAKQATLDGAEFPKGLPVAFAKDGATVTDLTIHLVHGNNATPLNMVEMAAVVRRLEGIGLSKDEISAKIGRTTRHIDNLFVLAKASQPIKQAVATGKIAGAEAVKLLRKDPATAAKKVAEAVKKAESKGKRKATPKTMADPGPTMETIVIESSFPEGEKMSDVLKILAGKLREQLQIGDDDLLLETGTATIRLNRLVRTPEPTPEPAPAAETSSEVKTPKGRKKASKPAAETPAPEPTPEPAPEPTGQESTALDDASMGGL